MRGQAAAALLMLALCLVMLSVGASAPMTVYQGGTGQSSISSGQFIVGSGGQQMTKPSTSALSWDNTNGSLAIGGALSGPPTFSVTRPALAAHNDTGFLCRTTYTRSADYQQIVVSNWTKSSVSSGTFSWDLTNFNNFVQHVGSGTSTQLLGAAYKVGLDGGGTISFGKALEVFPVWGWNTSTSATGTYSTAIGLNVRTSGPGTQSYTISDYRAINLENPSITGLTITTKYGIYDDSASRWYIRNISAAPSNNPTSGGFLYVESGALKYRGSSGTVTTIANP